MDYIVKVYKDWKLHSQFHEIVPDMDEDFVFNEKQSIRDSARSLKKYGSTCYNQCLRSNETLVRHEVEKTDTLQGIALKYGCTTEQIRRANRLFASDSLFLRQYLLIPVEKSSSFIGNEEHFYESSRGDTRSKLDSDKSMSRVPSSLSTTSVSSSSNTSSESFSHHTQSTAMTSHPLQQLSPPDLPPSSRPGIASPATTNTPASPGTTSSNDEYAAKHSKSLDCMAPIPTIPPEEENRRCIHEFLTKIDNTISESRKYVERSREIMMASQSDGDLFAINNNPTSCNSYNNVTRKNVGYGGVSHCSSSSQQQHQHHHHHHHHGGSSDTTYLLNTTQMRHVQNSLKRLEQQQDQFFEL